MKYTQNSGVLDGVNPGSRVRGVLDGDGPDVGQSGLLGGGQPGERVRNLVGGEGSADLGQGGLDSLEMPDSPGPAVAGRTPLVGTVRRSQGMTVVRDELSGVMG